MHIDASTLFDRFAVGGTGVIQPSSAVTAAPAINDPSIGEAKIEGVSVDTGMGMLTDCLAPGDDAPLIFDDTFAGLKRLQGEDAAAMNR